MIGPVAVERLERLPAELLRQRKDEAAARARDEARTLHEARARAARLEDEAEAAPWADRASVGARAAVEDTSRLQEALKVARAASETMAKGEARGFIADIFVRRYSRDTRPWIGFHTDRSAVTVNVALASDGTHEGGRLHAIIGGAHTIVEREEGEATVHGDDLMHAVSAMRAGVRYSLVMLYFFK